MNIKIYIEKNLLILKYYQFDHDWIKEKFDSVMEEDIEEEVVTIKKIFDFKKKDIINSKPDIYNEEEKYEYFFKLGEVINDEYIKIQAGIICHKEIRFYDYPNKFDIDWFKLKTIKIGSGSVFGFIAAQLSKDRKTIAIGNTPNCLLNWTDFKELISKMPNNYEIDLFINSRVTGLLKQYTLIDNDYELRLNNYRKKRKLSAPIRDYMVLYDSEIAKYEFLLEEMKSMVSINNIDRYSEDAWQKQIARIFLLLFPKYIHFFEKVPIKDSYREDGKKTNYRYPDFILINNNGNVDILEIKKPTSNSSILRTGLYRDSYIPNHEFTGTIMQVEKYILNLIKWGTEGEKNLNEKYNSQLPEGVRLQINSPKAILILGYEKDLAWVQSRDLEIIKRKYANVVDIISYDDLIKRLENTLIALRIKRLFNE